MGLALLRRRLGEALEGVLGPFLFKSLEVDRRRVEGSIKVKEGFTPWEEEAGCVCVWRRDGGLVALII